MILNTKRLFLGLLSTLEIDVVCDVGSLDGAEALLFHRIRPRAHIWAFEAHPQRFQAMQKDPALAAAGIETAPLALSNFDGEARFFLVDAPDGTDVRVAGMSSLFERTGQFTPAGVISVAARRLDTYLSTRLMREAQVALWIDAEGKGYEVLEGATGIASRVRLVHVEVESSPCINAQQRLYPEVQQLLRALGFLELGTDGFPTQPQFNALFVRHDLPRSMSRRVRVRRWDGGARSLLARTAQRIWSACAGGRSVRARHG